MTSIRVGDVVVCVDLAPRKDNNPGHLIELRKLREGAVYRVSEAGVSNKGTPFIRLTGIQNTRDPSGGLRSFRLDRFRKVQKADDAFTRQIRALNPSPRRSGERPSLARRFTLQQEHGEMKPLPTDPFAMQARATAALCADLFDIGAGKARTFERTEALRATLKATRKERS